MLETHSAYLRTGIAMNNQSIFQWCPQIVQYRLYPPNEGGNPETSIAEPQFSQLFSMLLAHLTGSSTRLSRLMPP